MWELFIDNSLWIIFGTGTALIVLVTILQRIHDINEKLPASKRRDIVNKSMHISLYCVVGIGLVLVLSGLAALLLSRSATGAELTVVTIQSWIWEHGIFVVSVVFIAYLFHPSGKLIIPKITARIVKAEGKGRRAREEQEKRAQTLNNLLINIADIAVVIAALLIILSEVGVEIGPLLAGAGVLAVAIGFGAQSLVKDALRGLLILSQNQYNRGDWIHTAEKEGFVEDISLLRTVLRDLDGTFHNVPNGEVSTVSNFTKEWSRINLNISVAYNEDLDHVITVMNRVSSELASDEHFGPLIVKPPEVLRVNNFGDSGIEIKILGESKPAKQWIVMGELRKRIKRAFDEEGINMAWPHVRLNFDEKSMDKNVPGKAT